MGIDPLTWMAIAGTVGAVSGITGTIASIANRPKKPNAPLTDFSKEREKAAMAEAERLKKMQGWRSTMVANEGSLGAPSLFKTKLGE